MMHGMLLANRARRRTVSFPQRYRDPWLERVVVMVGDRVRSGDCVLDVGGSERPTLPPALRPAGVRYVGLDPDAALARGAYDERITGFVDVYDESLADRFDVIVSWNTLEHVADVPAAFCNMRRYLKPGGCLVTMFSGRWALFAIASRHMPHRVRVLLMERLLHIEGGEHFPTLYDHCTYRAVSRLLSEWSEAAVVPVYRGANYLAFAPLLQRAYLRYEEWALVRPNLATHYLVTARRPGADEL